MSAQLDSVHHPVGNIDDEINPEDDIYNIMEHAQVPQSSDDDEDEDDGRGEESDVIDDSGNENEDGINESEKENIEDRTESRLLLAQQQISKGSKYLSEAEKALKAHILILCSSLGGIDQSTDSGEYSLGVDALACLKDLKRWIKTVDEATNSWAVAIACFENGLVMNDLIPILTQLPKNKNLNNKYKNDILLTTLELLMLLTKPLVLDINNASFDRVDQYIQLKKAHIYYKNKILNFENGLSLKSVVGITIPILVLQKSQRTHRDYTILNLCLHFFRNIIRIEPADTTILANRSNSSKVQQRQDNMPPGINKEDISFNTLIYSYKRNKVFDFIQTISAGLNKEFLGEVLAPVCLECYFYITYAIHPEDLILDANKMKLQQEQKLQQQQKEKEQQKEQQKQRPVDVSQLNASSSLSSLYEADKNIKKALLQKGLTRHSNFGTLLTVKSGDDTTLTMSGQDKLLTNNSIDPISQLDSRKKAMNLQRGYVNHSEATSSDFDTKLNSDNIKILNEESIKILNNFFSDFVENGFGILIQNLRKQYQSTDGSLGAFLDYHYFFIISWILKFERLKREADDLNIELYLRFSYLQETFTETSIIILMNKLDSYLKEREFNILRVCVNYFKELLSTIINIHSIDINKILEANKDVTNEDSKEELTTYQTASEALLRKLFDDEQKFNVLFLIPMDAHRVSLNYSHDIVEFTHVLLKAFKYLSNLKTSLTLSKKNRKALKKLYTEDNQFSDSEEENEIDDDLSYKNYVAFDKFRLESYERRLMGNSIVNLYVNYFSNFNELDERKLRLCLSYFHKILTKKDQFMKLFRLDFMLSLHELKYATSRFSKTTMKDFSKFLSYFMYTLQKLWNKVPVLGLELLSQNIENDNRFKIYLATGDVQEIQNNAHKISTLDKTFTNNHLAYGEKITILTSILFYDDSVELIDWLIKQLDYILTLRKSWEDSEIAAEVNDGIERNSSTKEDTVLNREKDKFVLKNSTYRLLLSTIGFVCDLARGGKSTLPSSVETSHIESTLNYIKQAKETPAENDDLNKNITGVRAARKANEDDNDEDGNLGVHNDNDEYDEDDEDEDDRISGNSRRKQTGFEDLADDNDALDLMEARIQRNSDAVKGVARKKNGTTRRKRKRVVDEEDDDDVLSKYNKKKDKKAKKVKKSKKQKGRKKSDEDQDGRSKISDKQQNSQKEHLSSKFVDVADDLSDEEEERAFFERERRLQRLIEANDGKPLTPEQIRLVYESESIYQGNGIHQKDQFEGILSDTEAVISKPALSSEMVLTDDSGDAENSAVDSDKDESAANIQNGESAKEFFTDNSQDTDATKKIKRIRNIIEDSDDE
ncbi:unnamed protein product [[Candida] boidinii]|uniref:Unnamed protein product n=1 Tax=Candida boidinii TaxID=5477 RepID=A0ACB5TEN1_CANBO|nr:unnamed protein product [[Candida] boidinii]